MRAGVQPASQPVGPPAAGLLDVEDQPAALEDRDRAGGLRDADGDRVGGDGDRRGGLVPGAQALGEGLLELAARGEVAPGAQDHAVAADDERAVDRRELLDRLLEPGVEDVPLALGIAVERVE